MARLNDKDAETRRQRELAGTANPADFSEALARGLAVLSAFGKDRKRLTQADLARQLGLSRATVRRAVLTLEHLGYLVADGRAYELTPRVLGLAGAYLTSNLISTVVQPVCDRVCAQFKASCSAAVLDGDEAVMIARAIRQSLLIVGSGVGYRVPAASSALGKVLLAHLDTLPEASPVAGPGRESLREIRQAGYCYVANDVEPGFHSIAVPVSRWDGRVVAALNVGAAIEHLSPQEMQGSVLEVLRTYAEDLRAQLV
ncbi:IclR family transcriptional regulator C-terminal domain-containing protein [Streptomyces sp. NPDC047841]|uniref:IclR family transcriptional regulator domain-containing protein n=1 Tax=Streptomyces sp. NPDC047841 TaxID=3154708 RepID=UPI003455519A